VRHGNLRVVEYLVNHKADINAKARYKKTLLHLAAQKGHLSVVEYLVNLNADINEQDTNVEYLDLNGLLFILLPRMVILVLLNILLINKLILI